MKRILSTLLAFCMVLSMIVAVPFTTSAESFGASGVNSSTVGASGQVGYDANKVVKKDLTNIPDITTVSSLGWADNTSVREYKITNAAGLKKLDNLQGGSQSVNNGLAGYTFYLANDIDLNGVTDFYGIGQGVGWQDVFAGTFDGQGYAIKNWKLTVDANNAKNENYYGTGLFGYVVSCAVIKNVVMENCAITMAAGGGASGNVRYIGGLVGWLNRFDDISTGSLPTVENCKVSLNLTSEHASSYGNRGIGGVVGKLENGTVRNCTFSGTVSDTYASSSSPIGGVIGNMLNGSVTNCLSNGTVSGQNTSTGGVVGNLNSGSVTNCSSSATVSAKNGSTGGVVGLASNASSTVSHCSSTAQVTAGNVGVGGVIGKAQNGAVVQSCLYSGTKVHATATAPYASADGSPSGGIVGFLCSATVDSCLNSGTPSGVAGSVGGVVGFANKNSDLSYSYTIKNCVNQANLSSAVTGGNARLAGIIGTAGDGAGKIVSCTNKGNISAVGARIGGIIGYQHGSNTVSNNLNSGTITNTASHTGGIIGYSDKLQQFNNNVNEGAVNGTGNTAGMIGCACYGSVDAIVGCVNRGEIKGTSAVGGLFGLGASFVVTINKCVNEGKVTSSGTDGTGAICGQLNNACKVTITNCENHGHVTSPFATSAVTGKVISGATHSATGCTNTGIVMNTGYVPTSATEQSGWHHSIGNIRPEVIDSETKQEIGTSRYDAADIFQVRDVADLRYLATLVANGTFDFAGKTIYLVANLDFKTGMTATDDAGKIAHTLFAGIGTNAKPFKGTFDGQGYTISNFTLKNETSTSLGFFNSTEGATIKNLRLVSSNTRDDWYACPFDVNPTENVTAGQGALIGWAKGSLTVDNVYSDYGLNFAYCKGAGGLIGIIGTSGVTNANAIVTIKHCTQAGNGRIWSREDQGGIVGLIHSGSITIESCEVTATRFGGSDKDTSAPRVGGFIGYAMVSVSSLTMKDCLNKAHIYASINIGGLIGASNTPVIMEDCRNEGSKVEANGHKDYAAISLWNGSYVGACFVGGLIGQVDHPVTMTNCENNADVVTATKQSDGSAITYAAVGGLVGVASGTTCTLTNCVNNGDMSIAGGDRHGGLVGTTMQVSGTLTITGCTNNGNIVSAGNRVGGIVGYHDVKVTTVRNCVNNGNVTATAGRSSGIIALVSRTGGATIFENCTNYGIITASVGSGIIGLSVDDNLQLVNVKNYAKLNLTNSAQHLDGLIGDNGGSGVHKADANCANYANTAQWEGYQTRTDANGKTDLRLIGSIDSINYGKVGFLITWNGQTATGETRTAYITLDAAGETVSVPAYRGSNARFFTFEIWDIPTDQTIELTITTYTVLNGVTVYGESVTKTIN